MSKKLKKDVMFDRHTKLPADFSYLIKIKRTENNLYLTTYMNLSGQVVTSKHTNLRAAVKYAINLASFIYGSVIVFKHHVLQTYITRSFQDNVIMLNSKPVDMREAIDLFVKELS